MKKQLIFKENDQYDMYRWDGKKWVESDEDTIHSLWSKWLTSKGADTKYDKDGFLVYFIDKS